MAAAHQRFSSEISDGRLTIVGAAVAAENGSARLAIADDMTIWSTLDAEFVARNSGKTRYRYVDVPAVQFAELLREHGVPYYLKVDIEGSDMLALGALHAVSERSQYVSLESTVSSTDATAERVESEFAELWSLGYRRFQFVNQRKLPRVEVPTQPLEGRYVPARFTAESSGAFGRELSGRWLTRRQARTYAELLRIKHNLGGYGGRWRRTPIGFACAASRRVILRRSPSWYDLHARLGD